MEAQVQGAGNAQLGRDGFVIIVNGTEHIVQDDTVTFAQLLALAFPTPPTGDQIDWHVSYEGAIGPKHSGALVAGQSVKVSHNKHEPTVFSVDFTNRS